ncbi:MAG: hypothetical protein IJ379_10830 [Lachnospiraceae bacterium]|nr:hypothetical protein [Lachnospiraceae bacterium]
MSEKEFYEKIKEGLIKRLGEDTQINLQEVRKNNNVVYKGLIIHRAGSNIAPTIYMNAFYEMYEEGDSFESIMERVWRVYQKGELKNTINMEFFADFEKVKDRIVYRLIHAQKNKELLQDMPHIQFMDLAICFYYAFYNEELGDGMIMIHNNHMEMWGTSHQELMRLAQENTRKLFPPMFITLDTIVHEVYEDMEDEWSQTVSFYVLTNRQKSHGAASILYPDMLELIAEKLDGNFYILPSSIHEVILFKDQGEEDEHYLHEMIVDANTSQLLEEEILSDYPYYYNKSDKKLTQVKTI